MTTRNIRLLFGGGICAGVVLLSGLVNSQTSNGDPPNNDIGGNDSPAGVSSGFSGWVNTACAYDPYTGNARRVIDDIVVPGTLGAYPLKWTRFYNSRDPEIGNPLGVGWRHSYLWSEDYEGGDIVRFPDGREIDFNEASGISERLPQVGQLILGDGGQVIFDPVTYNLSDGQHVKYRVARIIDPYGLTTTISYDNIGTDDNGNAIYRISRITEPGGRYLLINYSATDGTQISGVQAFTADNNLTQSVSYVYSDMSAGGGVYTTLTGASYSDGTTAQYTYQDDNSGNNGSPKIPLLKTCDDVRYPGPMHQIEYAFVAGDRIRGKIKSEKKPGSGEAVSTLTFPSGRSAQNRIETRGDGPKRTFSYSSTGMLLSYTDFKNNASIATHLGYDANNFVGAVTDAGNHQTTYTNEPVTGKLTRVLYADQTSHVDFDYGDPDNPYYLRTRTDERQHTTYFYRDANHRVSQINYPGPDVPVPYETFAYNAFGQVLTHLRTNGFYEHFVYDGAGRLRKAWNPTATATWPPSDAEPHMEFDYYPSGHPWADRVSTVKDQLQHSTAYEYDRDSASQPCAGRGLVTRATHLVDGTYISFAYDQFGNAIAAENELRQRTWFSYDDYSRVITVTPPAPAGAMTLTYEPTFGTADPYLHTARAVHLKTDGAGVTVENKYDENFRVKTTAQLDGTASPPTTSYDHWPVGTLYKVHDPRNYNWTTTYTYDPRNQLETVMDALNHMMTLHHDPAGNVDWVQGPDGKFRTGSYDEMNRALTKVEPVTDTTNKTTTFTYWPSGMVHTVKDDNQQPTIFEYDESDLKTRMTYPDRRDQAWSYDDAKNLVGRSTVGGKFQWFYYDGRNRLINMVWDGLAGVSDWANFGYDAANRLTSASNENGTITRQYDDAGRLLTEAQNVYGLGAKTITYGSDAAGKRTAMGLVGTDYQFGYQYDAIGRLEQILNVQNSPDATTKSLWYQYAYDAASNQIQRYCPMNGVAQNYQRDELGRIKDLTIQNATAPQYGDVPSVPSVPGNPGIINYDLIRHLVSGLTGPIKPPGILAGLTNLTSVVGQAVPTVGAVILSEHYLYDAMSRVSNVQRGGQDDGFGYDYTGQLTSASYSGWNGNGTRSVSYSQDNLGNRSQVNDNGGAQSYSRNPNYLNQYATAPAGAVSNGSEHEIAAYDGLSYTYIGDRQLASVTGNGSSYALAYDALGRCVKRTLNGTTIYYTYDGPHPIYEWKADGTRAGWNLYGQGIDEILLRADYQVISNGQGYFFQQNRLGSVTHLTGFSGEVIESYRYDAFGQPTTTYAGGNFNNRFKFTGREYQAPFGVYEYRARAYHPGLGRFLSEDPIGFAGGDANLFRYCDGDPVNGIDPSGLDQWTVMLGDEGAIFLTWGTNGGQRNFGIYGGIGLGVAGSYDPHDSGLQLPGTVGGAVGQAAVMEAGLIGVDVSFTTMEGGKASVTGNVLVVEGGVSVDQSGNVIPVGPMLAVSKAKLPRGLGAGAFFGVGVTRYGPLPYVPPPRAPSAPPPYLGPPPTYHAPDGSSVNENGTRLYGGGGESNTPQATGPAFGPSYSGRIFFPLEGSPLFSPTGDGAAVLLGPFQVTLVR